MNTQTETKHTPGPWKFSFESIDPEWAVVTNGYGLTIANVNADSRQEANARLIAAAPELLEALRAVLPLLDIAFGYEGDVFGSSYNAAGDADAQARAAIAKATGGAL